MSVPGYGQQEARGTRDDPERALPATTRRNTLISRYSDARDFMFWTRFKQPSSSAPLSL